MKFCRRPQNLFKNQVVGNLNRWVTVVGETYSSSL